MCCRYLLLQQHYREVLAKLGIRGAAEFLSRYNIAPGTAIPAVRTKPKGGGREVSALHWGLVPSRSHPDRSSAPLANARAESLVDKPSFREAFRARRCLLPASGFYEWENVGRTKKPWLFRWRDEQPFALAGLWESWRAPDGGVLESCAVITTQPNEIMRPIHHRMPVMLMPDQFDLWLDPLVLEPELLSPLLRVASATAMSSVAVSQRVNNARHDAPDCLAPAGEDEPDPGLEPQLSLGL